jgi:hypothetical protein
MANDPSETHRNDIAHAGSGGFGPSFDRLGRVLRLMNQEGIMLYPSFKEPVVPKDRRIEETLINVDDIPRPFPIQKIGTMHDKVTRLSGNAKDRRKQLRRITKDNPDCEIKVSASSVYKVIKGERVRCEDANTPRTIVVIKPKEK